MASPDLTFFKEINNEAIDYLIQKGWKWVELFDNQF